MQLQDQIEQAFGSDIFTRCAQLDDKEKLRFILMQGSISIESLLLSMQQVSALFDEIFPENNEVVVCLRTRSESSLFSHRSLLTELYTAGINVSDAYTLWVETVPEADKLDKTSDESWFHLAFLVPAAMLQKLIWCTYASDFGSIRLRPLCTVYLFNIKDQVMVLPFEDLSMDIIGADPALSAKLLSKFDQYLPGNVNKANPLDFDFDLLDKF